MEGLSYVIEDGNETLARKYKPRELLEVKSNVSNKRKDENEPTVKELVTKQNKKERKTKREGISTSNRLSKRTRSQNKNKNDNDLEIDLR